MCWICGTTSKRRTVSTYSGRRYKELPWTVYSVHHTWAYCVNYVNLVYLGFGIIIDVWWQPSVSFLLAEIMACGGWSLPHYEMGTDNHYLQLYSLRPVPKPLLDHCHCLQYRKVEDTGINTMEEGITLCVHGLGLKRVYNKYLCCKQVASYPGLLSPAFVTCSTNAGKGLVKLVTAPFCILICQSPGGLHTFLSIN